MLENITKLFDRLIVNLVEILPQLLLAIVLFFLGWVVAAIIQRLVRRSILYLNRVANENLKSKFLNVDLKGSAGFVSRTLFWIIILITLLVCIHVLKLTFLQEWLGKVVAYLPNIFVSVIIIFTGVVASRLADDLIRSAAARTGLSSGKYLGKIIRYLILFISIIVAIDHMGVNIRFLTNLIIIIISAMLLGASLAFGFGAKTSVSNILASYYVRKSYQLGSKIRIGEVTGIIVKITDHAVLLETADGRVQIPADEFNKSRITILKQ